MWLLRRTAASPGFGLRQPERADVQPGQLADPAIKEFEHYLCKNTYAIKLPLGFDHLLTYLRLTPGEEDKGTH